MSYRERVLESYQQSLESYGYSEKIIKCLLIAFNTGYDCGLLHSANPDKQKEMENAILYETEVM
jgi:hypothetical protein